MNENILYINELFEQQKIKFNAQFFILTGIQLYNWKIFCNQCLTYIWSIGQYNPNQRKMV